MNVINDEAKKIKAVELRKQGLPYTEIALKIGCSASSVLRWCRNQNIEKKKKRRENGYLDNEVLIKKVGEIFENNPKIRRSEMAESLGIPEYIVTKIVKKYYPEKRWYRVNTSVRKKDIETDTTRFVMGMQFNRKLENVRETLKIGEVFQFNEKKGEVVEKYEHFFVVKTSKGYKVCFSYFDYLRLKGGC